MKILIFLWGFIASLALDLAAGQTTSTCSPALLRDTTASVITAARSVSMLDLREAALETLNRTIDCGTECSAADAAVDAADEWLKSFDDEGCMLRASLAKILHRWPRTMEEAGSNELDFEYNYDTLLDFQHKDDLHQRQMETVEEVGRILMQFEVELVDAVEVWTRERTGSGTGTGGTLRDNLEALKGRLNATIAEAKRYCGRLETMYASYCRSKMKESKKTYGKIIRYMEEVSWPIGGGGGLSGSGSGSGSGRGSGETVAEMERFISRSLVRLRDSVESRRKSDVKTRIRRMHKVAFSRLKRHERVAHTCLQLMYRNDGRPPRGCSPLETRRVPSVLLTYNLQQHMCDARERRRRRVLIPARLRRRPDEPAPPPGILDLGAFVAFDYDWSLYGNESVDYIKGVTELVVPDLEWLVRNGWIEEEEREKGPFFLREFIIYPLPWERFRGLEVSNYAIESRIGNSSFISKNRRMGYNVFGQREEHWRCSNRPWVNRYNPPSCRQKLDPICRNTATGGSGEILPSATSTWRIRQKIHYYKRGERPAVPFPVGTFYLQADVEICFGRNRDLTWKPRRRNRNENNFVDKKDQVYILQRPRTCCADSNHTFFDPIVHEDDDEDDDESVDDMCPRCPSGSQPRLAGYYCEACPPGTEPDEGPLGCRPCRPGFFKADEGNEVCQACPGSEGYGQTSC